MSGGGLMKALAAALLVTLVAGAAAQTPGSASTKPGQGATRAAAAGVAAAPDEVTAFGIEQLRMYFALSPAWQPDPAFKAAVADIAAAHIKRVSALIPDWVAEERASSRKPLTHYELTFRLSRRQVNEIALTSLESAGEAHDEAWLAVYSRPAACNAPPNVDGFAARMAMLEELPKEQRDAALAGERALLLRWGTVRGGLPQRSAASVEMQVAQKIGQIKAGGKRDSPPMSPQLAFLLLTRTDESPLYRKDRCAVARWWLSMQPAGDASARRKVLDELRYTTMFGIADRDYSERDSAAKPDLVASYPPLATRYHVEGLITLKLSIDAEGKLQRAEVLRRDIQVPGIRGNRPVAFETLLDAAAVARAASNRYAKPAPEKLKAGVMVATQEMQFTLNPEPPSTATKE